MTRIIKTISLDETTAQIASELPNFSEFIRAKLLEHAGLVLSYYWVCRSCDKARSYANYQRPKKIPTCYICDKYMTELNKVEYLELITQ